MDDPCVDRLKPGELGGAEPGIAAGDFGPEKIPVGTGGAGGGEE